MLRHHNLRNLLVQVRIVKSDGAIGLFRGAGPTVVRAMALNMGMLASNDEVCSYDLALALHVIMSMCIIVIIAMALAAILCAVLGEYSAGIVPSQALLALCLLARMLLLLTFYGYPACLAMAGCLSTKWPVGQSRACICARRPMTGEYVLVQ